MDDVPPELKRRRHEELSAAFREEAGNLNCRQIGQKQLILIEGVCIVVKLMCCGTFSLSVQ